MPGSWYRHRLALIALGSGGIKPCVSSFVGDQFDQTNKSLARVVFDAFYWIINFGSFFASLLMPLALVFAEALRNGASDDEIARLTADLKQAMERYLQALAETARRDPSGRAAASGDGRRIDRQSLDRQRWR